MSSWKEYKLGEIGTIKTGKTPPAKCQNSFSEFTGIPFVTSKDMVGNKWISDTERYLTHVGFNEVSNYLVNENSISVSCIGSDMGKAVLLKNKSVTNQQINTLTVSEEHNYEYVYYVLSRMQVFFKSIAGGSATPILNKTDFSNIEILLPDLDTQNKTVEYLKYLDEKIQLNIQINQTLEQIAQTIFKSWFIDFDPVHAKAEALTNGQTAEQATQAAMAVISGKNMQELHRLQTANPEQYQQLWEIADAFPSGVDEEGVPWGWESKKVGEVAKFIKGKKPKLISSEPDEGFLPHILMASLSGKYTEYAQIDKSIVCDIFDTLILMDGAASGKIAIGHRGVIGSTFAKIELSENKYWALFNQFMFSKEQDIQANTTGTSIPHTDKARVLDYEMVVPCDVVLNYFTEMYKNILCSSLNQRKNSFVLENVRDLLLPKLLSGEIHL